MCPRTTTDPKFLVFNVFPYFFAPTTFTFYKRMSKRKSPTCPIFFHVSKTNFQASVTSLTDVLPTQQRKAYNFGFEAYWTFLDGANPCILLRLELLSKKIPFRVTIFNSNPY
jgi:hypothetical protein